MDGGINFLKSYFGPRFFPFLLHPSFQWTSSGLLFWVAGYAESVFAVLQQSWGDDGDNVVRLDG